MKTHFPRQLQASPSTGFSLVEVLASLVIVLIALAALSPSIILAAATRIHTQRIEAATNLAYEALDDARATLDRGPETYTATDIPPAVTGYPSVGVPPAGTITQVDGYFVQTFRDAGCACPAPNTGLPCIFNMGVRVYSEAAFASGTYSGTTDVTPLSGNVSGPQAVLRARERPLVFLTGEIGSQSTLQQYGLLIGGGTC
ncbi:MAG: prepilin-type N-terminal cleavage/methylation domain-containing protein [Cyanobacteria bacterium J06642_2]